MAEASRDRVTITLGRSGQVVKRAGHVPDVGFSDSQSGVGSKRSVRERLGSSFDSSQAHKKRFRGDSCVSTLSSNGMDEARIGKGDLRYKLMQKNVKRGDSDDDRKFMDLREKLSRTGQPPRVNLDAPRQSPHYSLDTSRQSPHYSIDTSRHPPRMLDTPRQPPRMLDSPRQPPRINLDDPRQPPRINLDVPRQPPRINLDTQHQPPRVSLDSRQHMPASKDSSMMGRIPLGRSADDLPQMSSTRSSYSAWTLDHIRRRSPERIVGSSRGMSPPRGVEELQRRPVSRTYDDVRTVPYIGKDVHSAQRPVGSTSIYLPNSAMPTGSAKAMPPAPPLLSQLHPTNGIIRRSPYPGEEPLTVDGLLHSLGLGKYVISFKAEEVDMAALKQMGENDLKELGIPMGPRKKILLALLARRKQHP